MSRKKVDDKPLELVAVKLTNAQHRWLKRKTRNSKKTKSDLIREALQKLLEKEAS